MVKQVIGECGLPTLELDQIYRLSVVGITGKVGIGEFKVAMHLIHRRLNGYPIPYQGLAQLTRLHGQMGNQIAQIEARPESSWQLAALVGCVMRASAVFWGDETEALKKCGLMAEQFKQTYHLDTPIRCVVQSDKSASGSVERFKLVTGLMGKVPNDGAIILATDGPEGICDDVAASAAFAEQWRHVSVYLAMQRSQNLSSTSTEH